MKELFSNLSISAIIQLLGFTRNNKRAFTLAEVLITLAIMGTIMAITVPTLISTTNRNTYVNGLKKTYGMLDMATNQLMVNNSGTFANLGTGSTWVLEILYTYDSILDFENEGFSGAGVYGFAWANSTNKLSGGAAVESFDPTATVGIVLTDGTYILFLGGSNSCTAAGVSVNLPYASDPNHLCGTIYVDVNGIKGPNTFGRDMFVFLVGSNGIHPGGDPHTKYNDLSLNCNPSEWLWMCLQNPHRRCYELLKRKLVL